MFSLTNLTDIKENKAADLVVITLLQLIKCSGKSKPESSILFRYLNYEKELNVKSLYYQEFLP